jgi:MFS family permease
MALVNFIAPIHSSPKFLPDSFLRSFLCQVPLMVLAIALVYFKLENPTPASEDISENEDTAKPKLSKFRRIDFIGSVLLTGAIIGFILGVDLPGRGLEWSSPLVVSLLTAFVVLGTAFLIYEGRYAHEPIFPPRLLVQRKVSTVYITQALQMAAQMAVCFSFDPLLMAHYTTC